jgi:hypothetical protein
MEAVKELMSKLDKINNKECSAILPSFGREGCVIEGGRNSGVTVEVLQRLQEIVMTAETMKERPRILVIGNGSGVLSKHMMLFLEAVKQANIDIVFHVDSIGSIGELKAFEMTETPQILKDKEISYKHTFEAIVPGIDGALRKKLNEMIIENFNRSSEDDLVQKEVFNRVSQKYIPIKGKVVRKARLNTMVLNFIDNGS